LLYIVGAVTDTQSGADEFKGNAQDAAMTAFAKSSYLMFMRA
jgi:hypothetical protein